MPFNMGENPLFKFGTNRLGPIVIQLTMSPHGGLQGVARYVVVTIGMIATAVIMSLAVGAMQSRSGVPGPTIADAASPATAAVVLLATLLAAFVISAIVGRLVNAVVGLFVLGWGLAVLSMQCGTIANVVFDGGGLLPMALETAIWGVIVLLMTVGIFRISGPLPDLPLDDPADACRLGTIFSPEALRSCIAGLVILPAVWFLLVNDLKGQAIGTITVGGILAGMGARLLSPLAQPILIFAAPVFVGAIGIAFTMGMQSGSLDEMFVLNTLPRIGRPMPLDYAAGSLVGVAIGLGWARGMVEGKVESESVRIRSAGN
ncbi:MAG: hypothetical protein MK085_10650 [Phycisphaerales bacterium]|nr:hypothetical protein [Phycisphaerales bacterium]